jgi:hypothetical protein
VEGFVMKKILLLLALILLMIGLPGILTLEEQSSAGGGCCMERSSRNSKIWRPNGLSFRRCRDSNRKRDGDDLYERKGYIYWEENC